MLIEGAGNTGRALEHWIVSSESRVQSPLYRSQCPIQGHKTQGSKEILYNAEDSFLRKMYFLQGLFCLFWWAKGLTQNVATVAMTKL